MKLTFHPPRLRKIREPEPANPCVRCGKPSHPCYGSRCEDCWAFCQFIHHGRHQLVHIVSEEPQNPIPENADTRHERRRV